MKNYKKPSIDIIVFKQKDSVMKLSNAGVGTGGSVSWGDLIGGNSNNNKNLNS